MSVRIMANVFDYSESKGSDRLVLLVIADRSNDDGEGCYRGKDSIARKARVSRTTVTESFRRLIELGELEITHRPGHSSLYRVLVGGPESGLPVEQGSATRPADRGAGIRPTSRPPVRPTVGHPSGRDTSPTPSRDTSVDTSAPPALDARSTPSLFGDEGASATVPDPFDDWWAIYPKKVAKQRARILFRARLHEGVSLSDLMLAVKHYAHTRQGQDDTYTMHPTTFLAAADGRWSEWVGGDPDPRRGPEDELVWDNREMRTVKRSERGW